MMKNGGQAFPGEQGSTPDGLWNQTYDSGMTLRDWFAGQALIGWLASFGPNGNVEHMPSLAGFVYEVADEMLAERDKGAE